MCGFHVPLNAVPLGAVSLVFLCCYTCCCLMFVACGAIIFGWNFAVLQCALGLPVV